VQFKKHQKAEAKRGEFRIHRRQMSSLNNIAFSVKTPVSFPTLPNPERNQKFLMAFDGLMTKLANCTNRSLSGLKRDDGLKNLSQQAKPSRLREGRASGTGRALAQQTILDVLNMNTLSAADTATLPAGE
jgi:hypothetical protein